MLMYMPYDGIYKLQHFFSIDDNARMSFPLAMHHVPAGHHGTLNFHRHDSIEIAIVTEGQGIHILNEKKACIRKGDVIVIYPNALHAYDETSSLGILNILYSSERMTFPAIDGYEIPLYAKFFPLEAVPPESQSPEPLLHLDSEEAINAIVKDALALEEILEEPTQGKILQTTVKFLDIILKLLQNATPPFPRTHPNVSPAFQDVLKYINENFTGEIKLEELYKRAFCSCRSFEQKFKKLTGFSPGNYVLRRRIALATTLLLKENLSINDVCGLCGFNDRSYFTLQFRRITGLTPRDYRKQHLLS